MGDIRKIGSFMKKDAEGFLQNECRADLIPPVWREALEETKQYYLNNLGERVHGIYVRGSLPLGQALEGFSDVDTFAVLKGPLPPETSWVSRARGALLKKYPFARDFEFHFVPLSELISAPGYFSYRFLIKCLSLCIHGEDLSGTLPKYRPSLSIAFALHGNLREVLEKARSSIQSAVEPDEIKFWCQWVCKRLVRTGFAILMEKEKEYTRDLYCCYEVFCRHRPERARDMREALAFAVNPSADKAALTRFLGDFGTWLAAETEATFRRGRTRE